MVTTLYGLGNLTFKPAAQYATTAALPSYTATSATLIATSNGALPAIDGVGISAGDRVLVRNETSGSAPNNGIWVVTQAGSAGTQWILTRSPDMTTGGQFPGAVVYVEQGTVNGGLIFCIESAGPFTPGSTNVTWTALGGASGFPNPMTTQGDLLGQGSSSAQRIAGDTSNNRKFLRGQAISGVAQVPAWDTLTAADIPQLAAYAPAGLTGATAASRYVGATASGHPTTGTFTVGDFVIDRTGTMWVCTSSGSPGTWVQPVGSGLTNPMTTQWDLIVGGASGAPARLALGANGQVLGVLSGGIAWVNNPAGFANPMSGPGDLIYGGTAGAATRLGAALPGQTLTVNPAGTAPAWITGGGLQASGDTSGVTDAANINALLSAGGSARLGPGTFYVNQTNTTTGRLNIPFNGYLGGIPGQTVINFIGSGGCIRMFNPTSPPGYLSTNSSPCGTIENLILDGSGTSSSINSFGIHYGDGWAFRIDNVWIRNFSNTAGSIGIWEDNTVFWVEKATLTRIVLWNNSLGWKADVNGGSGPSHMYNHYEFAFKCLANQNAMQITAGSLCHHCQFDVRGNFIAGGSNSANSGICLQIGDGSNSTGSRLTLSKVNIQVEADQNASTDSHCHQTLVMDTDTEFQQCSGLLSWDPPGNGVWQYANFTAASATRFAFAGIIDGDPNLNPAGTPGGYGVASVALAGAPIAYAQAQFTGATLKTGNGDYFSQHLSATITVDLTGGHSSGCMPGPQRKTIRIQQAASGGPYAVNWPNPGSPSITNPTVVWAGGNAPTMSTGANDVDYYFLETIDGITWVGRSAQNVS